MAKLLRILIVEDSEDDALLLVRWLRRGGYEPDYQLVATPEEMIRGLSERSWDLVIADYSLPHFSGPAALALLKEKRLDIPFIVVSGVIGEETAVEAMRAGAHDYVMKGNLTRLIPAIERELREAETRRDRSQAHWALRESERMLATLMSNLPGMAYRCRNDRHWTMDFVSDGCEELTGYTAEDLTHNHRISYNDLIDPGDQAMVWSRVQEAINEQGPFHLLYRIHCRQGHIKWVWEKGRGVFSPTGELVSLEGFITDITERKRAEEQIRESLREKEVLLKEIHHRVKNNLQVIYSLLNLQSGSVRDPHALEMFKECQNRVRSMAIVHEVLYQSKDLARVNFEDYITRLAANLSRSFGVDPQRIELKTQVEDLGLEIDLAIPCGLIINELVSNALKYAFPNNRSGKVEVSLFAGDGGVIVLQVRDNGVGLPPELDFRNTRTLGLQLVNTLVDQLNGCVELDTAGGACFTVFFPGSNAKYKELEHGRSANTRRGR